MGTPLCPSKRWPPKIGIRVVRGPSGHIYNPLWSCDQILSKLGCDNSRSQSPKLICAVRQLLFCIPWRATKTGNPTWTAVNSQQTMSFLMWYKSFCSCVVEFLIKCDSFSDSVNHNTWWQYCCQLIKRSSALLHIKPLSSCYYVQENLSMVKIRGE